MDTACPARKEKFERLFKLLEQDEHVFVHINLQTPGVLLPDYLMTEPVVTLKLSHWFRGPVKLSDEKIVAELMFGEQSFTCFVPLDAVCGLTTYRGEKLIWPAALPKNFVKPTEQTTPPQEGCEQSRDTAPAEKSVRPQLRRVK